MLPAGSVLSRNALEQYNLFIIQNEGAYTVLSVLKALPRLKPIKTQFTKFHLFPISSNQELMTLCLLS